MNNDGKPLFEKIYRSKSYGPDPEATGRRMAAVPLFLQFWAEERLQTVITLT